MVNTIWFELDSIYHFSIDFEPNGISFGCKLFGNFKYNLIWIRFNLPFSDWFGTKWYFFWFQIIRKMVNTIHFPIDLELNGIPFGSKSIEKWTIQYFRLCVYIQCTPFHVECSGFEPVFPLAIWRNLYNKIIMFGSRSRGSNKRKIIQ